MLKNPPANAGDKRVRSLSREDPLQYKRQPTPVFLPGKSHGQRSLAGCSPWGCKESDTSEQLSTTSWHRNPMLPFLSVISSLLKSKLCQKKNTIDGYPMVPNGNHNQQ